MLTENTPEYVLAYYGVPLAGMTLAFVDHRPAPPEIVDLLVDATPTVLVTERSYLDTARTAAAAVGSIHTLVTVDDPPASSPTCSTDARRPSRDRTGTTMAPTMLALLLRHPALGVPPRRSATAGSTPATWPAATVRATSTPSTG